MVSYKPLWRLLVERDMSKCDLRKLAGLAPNTMTKMRKNEEVSMTVLNKICAVLNVNYGDIVEYIPTGMPKRHSTDHSGMIIFLRKTGSVVNAFDSKTFRLYSSWQTF